MQECGVTLLQLYVATAAVGGGVGGVGVVLTFTHRQNQGRSHGIPGRLYSAVRSFSSKDSSIIGLVVV